MPKRKITLKHARKTNQIDRFAKEHPSEEAKPGQFDKLAKAMAGKAPQAPKNKWRYGVVKRTYKTVLPDKTFTETAYELVEVYYSGKAWTSEAVSLMGASRKQLERALELALADIRKYDLIVEKKLIVRTIGKAKD